MMTKQATGLVSDEGAVFAGICDRALICNGVALLRCAEAVWSA
jgi:hypothetical protein